LDLYKLIRPLLWSLPAELSHKVGLLLLRILPRKLLSVVTREPILETVVWGRCFRNPIGLAAGFDKNAQVIGPSFMLGFGFIEVGGVTLNPQEGNPKPRLFRLRPDGAIINRMGLNSLGVEVVAKNMSAVATRGILGPVAVNLGLNKISDTPASDYAAVARKLTPYCDILTINVSSPNTPGLRKLQEVQALSGIVEAVRNASTIMNLDTSPVILVKISPDLNDAQLSEICQLALSKCIDGLVISNTTIERPDTLTAVNSFEAGGLSGKPIFLRSTEMLRKAYKLTGGRVPLVGVGGVSSAMDAYQKIKAGASLVQLYSALVYEGPFLVKKINRDLSVLLKEGGFLNIADAVGSDHRDKNQ
jgi:dihydroorotate dehydrogenase